MALIQSNPVNSSQSLVSIQELKPIHKFTWEIHDNVEDKASTVYVLIDCHETIHPLLSHASL